MIWFTSTGGRILTRDFMIDVRFDELIEQVKKTRSLKQTREDFGITHHAINKLLEKSGFDVGELIFQQFQDGLSVRQLQELHGLGHKRVSALLLAKGAKLSEGNHLRKVTDEQIRECHDKHGSITAAAHELGIDRATVRKRIQCPN